MKILKGILMVLMLGVAASVSAYPLLTFNAVTGTGNDGLSYDATTRELNILGTLTGSYDVTAPALENSSVVLTASFDAALNDASGYTFAGFSGGTLSIIDGDATTTLLDGALTNLLMYGETDTTNATMIGDYVIASGSLSTEFQNIADLFALELNLSGLFNSTIFESAFTGDVYGSVSSDPVSVSVPEPGVLFLFAAGLFMVGFTSRRTVR